MLSYSEVKKGKVIVLNGEPFLVVSSAVSRKQANKPVNKTKLKALSGGKVIEYTFHVSDNVEEADVSKKEITYIYSRADEHWFNEKDDKSQRFSLDESIVAGADKYLSAGDTIDALVFFNDDDEDSIIGLKLPIKVELEVIEAPPSIRGNTSSGGDKVVTTKTGLKVTTPLFIGVADVISVNTETGAYSERVKKVS